MGCFPAQSSTGHSRSGSCQTLHAPCSTLSPAPPPAAGTRSTPTALPPQPRRLPWRCSRLDTSCLGAPQPPHPSPGPAALLAEASEPQSPAAGQSWPPAPSPKRRQHAHVIVKIKLYSFGNKNIESAHQCTSSHLKTAEHIGHKVFRGKGDDPSHQGRPGGQREALPSPVCTSTPAVAEASRSGTRCGRAAQPQRHPGKPGHRPPVSVKENKRHWHLFSCQQRCPQRRGVCAVSTSGSAAGG